MSCAIVYEGDKDFCISLKSGEDVTGFTFIVLNEDGTPYDLTGIEHKITFMIREGGFIFYEANLAVSSNNLTWSYKYSEIDKEPDTYYAEISFINADDDLKILTFGPLIII